VFDVRTWLVEVQKLDNPLARSMDMCKLVYSELKRGCFTCWFSSSQSKLYRCFHLRQPAVFVDTLQGSIQLTVNANIYYAFSTVIRLLSTTRWSYTVRSESRYVLIKCVGSDVHERL
jgi:hypothetical protein